MRASYTAIVIAFAVSGGTVAAQNSGYSVTTTVAAPFDTVGADSTTGNFIRTTTADAGTCQSMCTGGPITQNDGSSKPCAVAIFTPDGTCYNFPAQAGSSASADSVPAGTSFFLRYDEPQTLSGDSSAICSPEQGDSGVLAQSGLAGDSTDYLACQCGNGRVNYSGSDGNSELACVADPSLASGTSSTTMSSTSSSSTPMTMSSASSSSSSSSSSSFSSSMSSATTVSSSLTSSPLFTSTSAAASSSAPTRTMTTTSSAQASSTAAVAGQPQPQASMKRRRRVRRSLLRFD